MLTFKIVLLVLISEVLASSEPFRNLGFDEAITNNLIPEHPFVRPIYGDGIGLASEFLPGWQLYKGTNQVDWVGLNGTPLGYGYATLINPNPPQGFVLPVEGSYSLDLVPSSDPMTLLQEGEIPAGSKSIQLLSYGWPIELEVNGSLVPLFYTPLPFDPRIPDFSQPSNAIGDISRFAGQTVELKFIAITQFAHNPMHGLDSIYFSSEAIPEPKISGLFMVGLIILASTLRLNPPNPKYVRL